MEMRNRARDKLDLECHTADIMSEKAGDRNPMEGKEWNMQEDGRERRKTESEGKARRKERTKQNKGQECGLPSSSWKETCRVIFFTSCTTTQTLNTCSNFCLQ